MNSRRSKLIELQRGRGAFEDQITFVHSRVIQVALKPINQGLVLGLVRLMSDILRPNNQTLVLNEISAVQASFPH
jgi:hypothetical protein